MKRTFFLVWMSSLFIIACGKTLPTVDSRTPETYQASLEQVSQSVPPEKKDNFNFSISVLALKSLKEQVGTGVIPTNSAQEEQNERGFQKSLHGLNYQQILAQANQLMKSAVERAEEQYAEALDQTIYDIVAAKKIKTELANIIISEKSIDSKNLSMNLENKTKSSLKKLLLIGTVSPTENSLPDTRVVFIDFEKPLAPKESRTVVIPLSSEDGWKPTDYLAVPRISLDIIRAEDTKQKVVIHKKLAEAFGEYAELKRNYQELQPLLQRKDDWVSVFTVDNISKGFFPLQ